MITLGVDAHKQVHVAVALDEAGHELGRWRGPNSPRGWEELAGWAAALGEPRQWGIEGAWNYGRGLAQHLVASGEVVYEVNPRWTALGRRSARKAGKSDPLDAHAVAVLVWREGATLPRVAAEDETAVLDLLVTEREGALAEATRLRNQIHHLLLQVDPEYRTHVPSLTTEAGLLAVECYQAGGSRASARARAAAGRRPAPRPR